MKVRNASLFGVVAIVAALAIAGCGGGGAKSTPPIQQAPLGAKVGVTITLSLPKSGSSSASTQRKTPQYVPASTQSFAIVYIGDNPSATPVPGSTPPPGAVTVATVNVTTSGTNPPPPGSCFNNSGSLICTITAQLPVGIIDLYIFAYDGQNGTGNIVANIVQTVQVSQSGAITVPGSSTPVSITLGASPVSGSVTMNAIAALVPNGTPNPAATPTSYPNNAGPFTYSAAGTLSYSGLSSNTPLSGEVITDNDTSGNSCLVYIPAGSTSATPCPFSTAKSTVTLANTSDSYAVLYNGKFLPGGAVSISASNVSSPLSLQITPTIFSLGTVNFPASYTGPVGALLVDPMTSVIYAGMSSPTTPLYSITYGASGFGTPTAVNVASVNGVNGAQLSGALSCETIQYGVNSMAIGPDNNIWIAEHDGVGCSIGSVPQFVAVYALHSAVVNPNGGPAIQPGPGVFAEYEVFGAPGNHGYDTAPLHGIASMGGYLWVISKDGSIWRIDPTTGVVSPNIATAYPPGTTPNDSTYGSHNITDSTGANPISGTTSRAAFFAPIVPIGGTLYAVNGKNSAFDALSVDTSASPSTGLCTPAGPPPCIATYVESLSGSLASTSYGYGGGTDGTSLYALATSGSVYKITPPSTLVTSASTFSGSDLGTIFVTPDGWLWTLASTGVQALQGMSSTAAPVTPTAVTTCNSLENSKRGNTAMALVPNGPLVFSPDISRGSSGTSFAAFCAVVY